HTWALARRHHVHARQYTERALRAFDEAERRSLDGVAHVFTFGAYVRDNLIAHYGLAPDRVTAVGSGMGAIQPWHDAKDFARPHLLFVAKHLFQAKGGVLLIDAFKIAHRRRSAQPRLRARHCRPRIPRPPAVGRAAAALSRVDAAGAADAQRPVGPGLSRGDGLAHAGHGPGAQWPARAGGRRPARLPGRPRRPAIARRGDPERALRSAPARAHGGT